MGNIDLSKLYKVKNNYTSNVSSNVILNEKIENSFTFSDIKFDLNFGVTTNTPINSSENKKDLDILKDEESILNSLNNLFKCQLYTRLLNPDYGINLQDYLFSSCNESTAWFIGYNLSTRLSLFEPRIEINQIQVTAYPNEAKYGIDMNIKIPKLNKYVSLKGILDENVFSLSFN